MAGFGSAPVFAHQTAISAVQTNAFRAERSFEIPRGALGSALQQWAKVTGIKLVVPADLVKGIVTEGVSGTQTAEAALIQLLLWSGLNYRINGASSSVAIYSASALDARAEILLDTVEVIGANPNSTMGPPPPPYAGGQVATGGRLGFLGNRSVMDTPFNQTSYTSNLIENQQARTLTDVLYNDPSVRPMEGAGSALGSFSVRGFPLYSNDVAYNGLFGIAPAGPVSTDFAERIELLKGPNALLNGVPPSGSIGGAINVVTKRAGDVPLTKLTTSYMSRGNVGGHVDIARRFGPNKECGVRFNGSYANGETSIKDNENEIGIAALGVDCSSDRFRMSADLIHQKNDTDGATRFAYVSPGVRVPEAPDASKLFTPSWWHSNYSDSFGMLSGEFDVLPNVTVYAQGGMADSDYHQLNGFPIITTERGRYTSTPGAQPYYARSFAGQTGVRGTFDTGPINHAFNINASGLDVTYGGGYAGGTTFNSNIYRSGGIPFQSIPEPIATKSATTSMSNIGIGDTLSVFDKRIQLTVGGRYQSIGSASYSPTGAETQSYDKSVWTPAVALLVRPWQHVSFYANYIEGLQQGLVVYDGFANTGEIFPPVVSKQKEVGVKIDWGTLTTTVGAFEITQPQVITIPGTPLPSLEVNGEQRSRGIEINTFGEILPGIRLLGGVAFIEGTQVKTTGGLTDGNRAIGVPDVQVNIGGEWDTPFVSGLTLTARAIYTSSQYLDVENTQSIPSWTRLDAGARYKTVFAGTPATIRFDVQNLLDESYWGSVNNGYIALGAPRTFLLSTSFEF